MGQYSIIKYLKAADAVTVLSLLSGFAAILFFSKGDIQTGSILLMAAAFFDWIDGKVARTLGGGTAFGKAIDIADLVSFGVAPAIMITYLFQNYLGYVTAAVFLIASLLRLARFQVTETKFSIGMPTTFNGIIFPAIFFLQKTFLLTEYVYIATALVSIALMLSSFEIKKIV